MTENDFVIMACVFCEEVKFGEIYKEIKRGEIEDLVNSAILKACVCNGCDFDIRFQAKQVLRDAFDDEMCEQKKYLKQAFKIVK